MALSWTRNSQPPYQSRVTHVGLLAHYTSELASEFHGFDCPGVACIIHRKLNIPHNPIDVHEVSTLKHKFKIHVRPLLRCGGFFCNAQHCLEYQTMHQYRTESRPNFCETPPIIVAEEI